MFEQQTPDFVPTDQEQSPTTDGGAAAGTEKNIPPAVEVKEEQVLPPQTAAAEAAVNGHDGAEGTPRWHVEAGRKGAHRVHQLIQLGKRYEQEHGLKRGRQRLRQLIELGRLYEQEHGLATPKGDRPTRMSRDELLETFFEALVRLAKPSVRKRLLQVLQALDAEAK
jgi:hypothetical protein